MPLRVLPETRYAYPQLADALPRNPLTQTMHTLAVARTLGVVARLGLFGELADEPVDVTYLANRFALEPEVLRMMLDLLVGEHYLECRGGEYNIAPLARSWLDPNSAASVTTGLSYSLEHWQW